jgi:hypothetical protein
MTNATFNISKKLTVVTNNCVYICNLSELVQQSNKFNTVNINGVTDSAKFNKYLSVMISNGYNIISENWLRNNVIANGVTDFSITLSK